MNITFLYPYFALLLLLLPLLWFKAHRNTSLWHKLLRSAFFVCVIVALTQPTFVYQSQQTEQVFILDQTAGLTEAARQEAVSIFQQQVAMQDGDNVTLIQLGGAPVNTTLANTLFLPEVAGSSSSLSSALMQALQAIPLGTNAAVTLISDGKATDTHFEVALSGLTARNIPVHTFELAAAAEAAFISDVQLSAARQGDAVQLNVTVEGDGQNLQLLLYHNNQRLAQSADFNSEQLTQQQLSFTAEQAGFMPIRLELLQQQRVIQQWDTVAAIQEPLKLLYLSAKPADLTTLQALVGYGFNIEQKNAAELIADTDFSQYQAVLLDNVPAQMFPAAAQQQLLQSVHEHGTGLIYSGGEAVFGQGGYFGSPLAEALPVTLQQDEQSQEPSVALAIIIDTSGSMIGEPLLLAKQIARLAVRKLSANDMVGIVEFYGARQWSVPMQPASQISDVERAIGRMQAQGASMLFPAIQEAYYGLKNTDARFKHMLVITDAGVEEDNYQQLLRHIAKERINVSTVLAGARGGVDGESKMMELATWGRGRFYAVNDEFSLVDLNLKLPQNKPVPEYQQGKFATEAQALQHWWQGIDLVTMPTVNGYSRTVARPQADTLFTIANTTDPLLASWQYGAGRVSSLMTEPQGQGLQHWQQWPDYGQFLARIVAHTALQQLSATVQVNRRFDQLQLTVQYPQFTQPQIPELQRISAANADEKERIVLTQKAPGLFVATVATPSTQDGLFELHSGTQLQRIADRAGSDLRAEQAVGQAFSVSLAELAKLTGGQFVAASTPADVKALTGSGGSAFAIIAIWPWLLLLAIALYLAELVYRRWPGRR